LVKRAYCDGKREGSLRKERGGRGKEREVSGGKRVQGRERRGEDGKKKIGEKDETGPKPIWQSGLIRSHKTVNNGRHNRLAEHGSP